VIRVSESEQVRDQQQQSIGARTIIPQVWPAQTFIAPLTLSSSS
jgi:hypothetical protein